MADFKERGSQRARNERSRNGTASGAAVVDNSRHANVV
jgi:hypothetical protein